MGFRIRKSIGFGPARINLSKSGLGMSVGVKGARLGISSKGHAYTSLSLPGTGIGYQSFSRGGSSRRRSSFAITTIPSRTIPQKPGLFAPKGEKLLYKAIKNGPNFALLAEIAKNHPTFHNTAIAFAAIKRLESDTETDTALAQLEEVLGAGYDPATDRFALKYLAFVSLTVGLANYPVARIPYSKQMLAVVFLSHLSQAVQASKVDPYAALLKNSVAGQIALAELYNASGQWTKTTEQTDHLTNSDDASMLLLIFRAQAFTETNYSDAAAIAFKECLRYPSRPDALKNMALFGRAKLHLKNNKPGLARKDLEKILANDSTFDGLSELLNKTDDKTVIAAAKQVATPVMTEQDPMPGDIGGSLGYFGLQAWWLSTFSERQRHYIEQKYQPMGAPCNSLTRGKIDFYSASKAGFLNSLAGWFTGPNDRVLGRVIAEAAKDEVVKSKNVLDAHFILQTLIQLYYRDQLQPVFLQKAKSYCLAQIKIQAPAAREFLRSYPEQPLPTHVGYEQLAIVYEREKKFEQAIKLCEEAWQNGWSGNWPHRIERLTLLNDRTRPI